MMMMGLAHQLHEQPRLMQYAQLEAGTAMARWGWHVTPVRRQGHAATSSAPTGLLLNATLTAAAIGELRPALNTSIGLAPSAPPPPSAGGPHTHLNVTSTRESAVPGRSVAMVRYGQEAGRHGELY